MRGIFSVLVLVTAVWGQSIWTPAMGGTVFSGGRWYGITDVDSGGTSWIEPDLDSGGFAQMIKDSSYISVRLHNDSGYVYTCSKALLCLPGPFSDDSVFPLSFSGVGFHWKANQENLDLTSHTSVCAVVSNSKRVEQYLGWDQQKYGAWVHYGQRFRPVSGDTNWHVYKNALLNFSEPSDVPSTHLGGMPVSMDSLLKSFVLGLDFVYEGEAGTQALLRSKAVGFDDECDSLVSPVRSSLGVVAGNVMLHGRTLQWSGLEKATQFRILSPMGNSLWRSEVVGDGSLDLSNWPAGVYLLQQSGALGINVQRLVLQ